MPKNNQQPNQNIVQVNIIESLASDINGHLQALAAKNSKQQKHKNEAVKVLDKWQRKELFHLRKAFEK